MRVAIISYVAGVSSDALAEALKNNGVEAKVFKKDAIAYDYSKYDYVFSYGCSAQTEHKQRINTTKAVKLCIDKVATFDVLKKVGVPVVDYVTKRKEIPPHWETVVVRKERNGRKAEGMQIVNLADEVIIPDGELFTEYFDYKQEYRVVVFRGVIVGRYFKRFENDWHKFIIQPKKGFEEMDKACLTAAKALGIDYVGFDVVAKTKKDFRVLEANSGPAITDEAEYAIVEYFINL